jgi:hypothetical protein
VNSSHIVNGTLNVNETVKLANSFAATLATGITSAQGTARVPATSVLKAIDGTRREYQNLSSR